MEIKEGFIVTNEAYKEKLIREQQGFINNKFLTPQELEEKLTFTISKGALIAIMKKYSFSYALAKEYLEAIPKLENKFYNHPKLDSIVSVYRFLEEHSYLKRTPLFPYYLKQFPLTFIDPDQSKEYQRRKAMVKQYTTVYEYQQRKSLYQHKVFEFQTILEECLYVFNQITNLLRKGISPKRIFIFNADESYQFLFRRLAKSYKISLNLPPNKNILSLPLIQSFLRNCQSASNFQEALKGLNVEDKLYSKIIVLINDYELAEEEPRSCIDLLTALFKEATCSEKRYKEAVSLVSDYRMLEDTEYGFYVGFNLGASPMLYKEQGFLNDNDLVFLGYSASYERNEQAYQQLEDFLGSTKNLTISYKCSAKTEEFLPSLLVQKLHMEQVRPVVDYGYARLEDELRLTSFYDEYLKYGNVAKALTDYGIRSIPYRSYQHKYKGLSQDLMQTHFQDKKLKLAYSNVKLYFACPFSYYADRILNLNEFKPQMAARLGTFSHAVLEDSYAPDFQFEVSALRNRKEYAVDAKDEFFFTQMEEVLRNILAFNQLHEHQSELKEIRREEHVVVERDGYTFEGFIDKLMYKVVGDDVYAAIVDYKTGADIVSLDNIEDGFHLQLPSYMYLLAHYEPFLNFNLHIIGIYLQKVNIVIFDNKSSVEAQMVKKFMLEGYTVSNMSLIPLLDPTFANSTYIKSLGLTRDGFRSYSKIFKEEQQNEIIQMVDTLMDTAAHNIKQGSFEIAPKMIRGKNESCQFCKYKDICFYEERDIVELSYKPFGKEVK